MKELVDSGLQVAEWSIDMTLHAGLQVSEWSIDMTVHDLNII